MKKKKPNERVTKYYFYIYPKQLKALRELARQTKKPMSVLIREAIDEKLKQLKELEALRLYYNAFNPEK